MAKQKTGYTEIDDIRDDLDSLKSNVYELTQHVKKDGMAHTQELKGMAIEQLEHMQEAGRAHYKNIERQVKAKPAQSMAIAFAAGLAASLLLRRR